jgi:hypothetical protein
MKTEIELASKRDGNIPKSEYSRTSIYRFSRKWRKQAMNAGKRLILETTFLTKKVTTFLTKKSHTLSFASWQNFASIENMTFQDINCFHGLRRLHCT